jgi:hypothetical protein
MITININRTLIPPMLSAVADDHGFFYLRKSALPASAKISLLLLMMVNDQQDQWNADTADAKNNKWCFLFLVKLQRHSQVRRTVIFAEKKHYRSERKVLHTAILKKHSLDLISKLADVYIIIQ